jgi:hypothetical protein
MFSVSKDSSSARWSVLQHFGIAGEKVAGIEAAQEPGFQQDGGSRGEDTDFILQSVEVDACFSAYGCVYHGKQGGRDVDVCNAAFESGSRKAAEVGDHSAAQVYQERMAGGSLFAQSLPHGSQSLQIFVHVFCSDNDFGGIFQCGDALQLRQAKAVCMFVGKDEKLVVRTFSDGMRQVVFQLLAEDYFLFTHLTYYGLEVVNYGREHCSLYLLCYKDSSFNNKTLSLFPKIYVFVRCPHRNL